MLGRAGAGGLIVNVTALLTPPAVVTVILCGPAAKFAGITRCAVIWFALTTGAAVVLIPAGRFSVAPARFVPVRVTGTLAPCTPDGGLIEVSDGGGGTT